MEVLIKHRGDQNTYKPPILTKVRKDTNGMSTGQMKETQIEECDKRDVNKSRENKHRN